MTEDFFHKDCCLLVPKLKDVPHARRDRWTHPFECLIFGMRFPCMNHLARHHRTHLYNGKEKCPFKCSLCKQAYSTKGNLNVHMNTHSQAKPYMCNICGSSTAQKTNHISHFRVHTGRKPFMCLKCTFCTSWNGNLK